MARLTDPALRDVRSGSSASRATASSTTARSPTCAALLRLDAPGSRRRSARRSSELGLPRLRIGIRARLSARPRVSRGEAGCATIRRVSPTATSDRPRAGARQRLDQLLVERGLADDADAAQALVLAGKVRVGAGDGARSTGRPATSSTRDVADRGRERDPYVSRGGHKLAGALDAFGVDPGGLVCLDVGASTGGFTDVLLQRGAARVYAVDVGRGPARRARSAATRGSSRWNGRTPGR